jgi:hypothetical protein
VILHLCWVRWDNGAAVAYRTPTGRCNWSYCGGGPSFRDVSTAHFVAAIESLLGWDHPAARQANDFARSAS